MLPRKLHVEEINRFHDELEKLSNEFKNEPDIEKQKNLSVKYFEMAQIWECLDNFIEFDLKNNLDILLRKND